METIFDLPAHPLFVHVPVVLAPLICLGAIAVAATPRWRRPYRWHLVVATGALLVAVQLTVSSGQASELYPAEQVETHEDLALTTRLLVIAWFVVTTAGALHAWWAGRHAAQPTANALVARAPAIQHAFAAVVALLGVLVTVWVLRTGHEGATIVWEGTV